MARKIQLISFGRQSVGCVAMALLLLSALHLCATTDYLVDDCDAENNLPSSTVTSIAQTRDGYIWVGTYNGLARYDGARYVTYDPVNTPELSQARIQGLFLDTNGTLWINTFRGGLTSYRDGAFHRELGDENPFDQHTTLVYSKTNLVVFVRQSGDVVQRNPLAANEPWKTVRQPRNARAFFSCADDSGTLWFLTRDKHVLRFINGSFESLPGDGGLPGGHINTLVADAHGVVWAGADNEIARWNGKEFEVMAPTNNGKTEIQPLQMFPAKSGAMWVLTGDRLRKMVGRKWVDEAVDWRGLLGPAAGRGMGFHEDRDGGLWFNHYGNGLFHILPDGEFQRITTQNNLPGDRVGAWFQSSDGGIWVGVDHGGLARLRDRKFHVIGAAEGLPSRIALSVCGGTNGSVLIGTAGGGLCTWQNGEIVHYPAGFYDSANFVFSIAPRPDGGAWLSASEGEDLYQYLDGRVQKVSWDVHGIKSILLDRQGRMWMGLKAGLAWWAGNDRQIVYTGTNGVLPAMRALAETPDGSIWAGADDGSIFRLSQEKLEAFRPKDELAGQPIYSLYADTNGTLWAGTFRGGLLRFKDGKFSRITAKQGLPAGIIGQILEDDRGRLWLGTHQGIYCVSKKALAACMDGLAGSVDYIAYTRHDGLPSLECSDGYQPASWRGPNGILWFTTVRGVVWVNPDELVSKSPPPPVLIEEVTIDGETSPLKSDKIVVPPGRQQYDFRFTALSFDAGDRARFRYQLEGYSGWLDGDKTRTAHFGPLPPREYKFHVIACNNDGVWNMAGATVKLIVKPYFYQTSWFLVLVCVSVLGGVAFGVRRMALLKYRRKLAQMEKEHAIERDRARIAKDIHDDVGAGLTQITLLTELARRNPDQTGVNLERITQSARHLTKAMDEIVWAVDPQHDTVAGLMDYISAYAEDYLRVAEVRCRMDLPVDLPTTHVSAELRYNLFLALKEALNNVVKHAKATEVHLRLQLEPNAFTLIVEDNGRGLPAGKNGDSQNGDTHNGVNRIGSGSGLVNLEKRLAAVGGRCEIHSEPGKGTRVSMTVFLKNVSPLLVIGADERKN